MPALRPRGDLVCPVCSRPDELKVHCDNPRCTWVRCYVCDHTTDLRRRARTKAKSFRLMKGFE
jgi:Zn ribbon nucleic-acid-binding protein